MTYKWRKKGFWKWKRYEYTLLDDVAELEFTSPQPLEPKECDVIFENARKQNALQGEFKTQKGRISYKYNPKTWTDEKTNQGDNKEVRPA